MNAKTGKERYQVIVIGAGPAGMTSALYLTRKGIKTLVLSIDIGGQVNWTTLIENYMGFVEIQGPELVKRFEEQMRGGNLSYLEDEVQNIRIDDGYFVIETKTAGNYETLAVIVATGKRPRTLNVPGEEKYLGKGIAYCSTCDAPLFGEMSVAVVGGGNSGVEAVLDLLAAQAEKIYLITNEKLTADKVLIDRIKEDPRVTILLNRDVVAISGEQFVNGMVIKDRLSGKEEALAVQGVFVEIGLEPNSKFLSMLEKNDMGEVVIDSKCRTSVTGIFAAGDVTLIPEKQIIVAAGEGAKAAIQAWQYIINLEKQL